VTSYFKLIPQYFKVLTMMLKNILTIQSNPAGENMIRINAYVLVLILCSFIIACHTSGDKTSPIRLGYLQNDLHQLPAFVAIEKGYFKEEGLTVNIAGVFRAGPEEMSAFGAKELDIGYAGEAPAIAAVLNGVADVKIISQSNLEGSSIVVRKELHYEKLAQLEGKTVAIPGHATMQDFLLRKGLKNSNTAIDKISIIVLKPPEMIQALDLGSIDAFIAWEPYPSLAVKKGIGTVLVSSKDIWAHHPCCVLVAETDFCKKNPHIIEKIKAVNERACKFINDNKDEAVNIAIKYSGMERDVVYEAVSNIEYNPAIIKEQSYEFIGFLMKLKYVRQNSVKNILNQLFYE
jgi:NitT/TauT family transport system substrate-binding protein